MGNATSDTELLVVDLDRLKNGGHATSGSTNLINETSSTNATIIEIISDETETEREFLNDANLLTRITWDCVTRLDYVQWSDATITISFVILGLINIMVIVGNTLVIMAVFLSEKLRTVTNLFIVSLAVADLLVGLAVLPFSTCNEVLGVWIFGAIWCQVWLAVDVWMCTSSILNLCAISLDRYLAVTRPVSYPNIMSPKRAKILIALVWCVSFVICFPPLVGWNDSRQHGGIDGGATSYLSSNLYNHASTTAGTKESTTSTRTSRSPNDNFVSKRTTLIYAGVESLDSDLIYGDTITNQSTINIDSFDLIDFNLSIIKQNDVTITNNNNNNNVNENEQKQGAQTKTENEPEVVGTAINNVSVLCQCQLISDKGYRIYSAIGSFYLPMFVMLFFYWRIYRAAIETTRAINQGFRTTSSKSSRFEEQRLTLRIHRGRSSNDLYAKTTSNGGGSDSSDMMTSTLHKNSMREGRPSPPDDATAIDSSLNISPDTESDNRKRKITTGNRHHHHHHNHNHHHHHHQNRQTQTGSATGNKAPKLLNGSRRKAFRRHINRNQLLEGDAIGLSASMSATLATVVETTNVDRMYDRRSAATQIQVPIFAKMGKRNIKAQVKRFRTETKAAKTLGIIVGGFILCWLPFFTIYLVGAFCVHSDCIPESLFAVAFWLGYCNSAINPCVYALFSRDFRNAFKRILCRCFINSASSGSGGGATSGTGGHNVKKRIVTMFPATFHLASFFEESDDGNGNTNSNS